VLTVGLLPALALAAGAACGTFAGGACLAALWGLPTLCAAAIISWRRQAVLLTAASLAVAFSAAGAVLAATARERALHPSLRILLDEAFGGFSIAEIGPEGDHDPLVSRAVLIEDAAAREDFVALRARVTGISIGEHWHAVSGGVSITVTGSAAAQRFLGWRAGRTIVAPIAFRRPARHLNEGVADFERDLALDGTALFGSIKSDLLVDVVAHGNAIEEAAADVRAHVRRAVGRWVTPHDAVAGAIVTAVLIGDRTGLPDHIRDRLQAAGTYHVIAISGGNVAILAALVLGSLMLVGLQGRTAAAVTIIALLGYAQVATAGPSVGRAAMMAVLYLGARLIDQRTAPWQATSMAAALMLVARPLDIRDPGFVLTFGATAALLEGTRRGGKRLPRHRMAAWLVASLTASVAVEIALLPVAAQMFSRVTGAGLVLNLIAVPAMGIVQIAGIGVALLDASDIAASAAGRLAYAGSAALLGSARLVDAAPWLTARVPPPGIGLLSAYYAALGVLFFVPGRALRVCAVIVLVASIAAMSTGFNPFPPAGPASRLPGTPAHLLRWTIFDVGQGEAMLVEPPRGRALLVDAAGAPFGSGSFDIGARVLTPALWARGLRSLHALLITHGDPDHLGGARAVLADVGASRIWEGIRVVSHAPMRELRDAATSTGVDVELRRAGEAFDWGGARIRVLHPPEADWERRRVRNDDSVVLEIVYGDVALLLTGDISAGVERALLTQLPPARLRILKVAHHGSRTSTSRALLEAWRPQIAVISCGRGNTFGHPTPEVLQRLESIGTRVFRTDVHGQITVETNGDAIAVRTYTGDER
jgi:competence protein ComEC